MLAAMGSLTSRASQCPALQDVVNRTAFGGWTTKIGTAVDDEDTEREAT